MIALGLKVHETYYEPVLHYARKETHGPGPVNIWHRHPVYHVVYATGGVGLLRVDDERINVGPRTLFFIQPNRWHQIVARGSSPFEYYVVTFELVSRDGRHCLRAFWELFDEQERRWIEPHLHRGVCVVPKRCEKALRKAFTDAFPPSGDRGPSGRDHAGIAVASFLAALGRLLRQTAADLKEPLTQPIEADHRRNLVDQALDFMNANYHKPLQLEDIARNAHLHPVYFSQLFKEELGIPPRQCLLKIRLNHARKLLVETNRSIGDIAAACGFKTVAYFSRAFRQAEKRSPSAYRRTGLLGSPMQSHA